MSLIGNELVNVVGIDGTGRPSGVSEQTTTQEIADLGFNIFSTSIPVNVMNFGAVNDGQPHPLSDYYSTLAAAQVVYPLADSLDEEIDTAAIEKALAYCITNNRNTIYFPASSTSGGFYRVNKFIDIPYTFGAREGCINFLGDIGSNDQRSYTACIERTISAAGFRFTGTSFASSPANNLIKQVNLKSIVFDGGWSDNNTTSDYPLIDVYAGYELFWQDAGITNSLWAILFREVWDSRFNNLRVTSCGEHNGKALAASMTSGSYFITVPSTLGLFNGQKIFGTGIDNQSIYNVTNGTTIEMYYLANATATRTVVFEAKAAVHVCGNNTTTATSNNLVITGLRIESCAGTGLRIQGLNNVDIWVDNAKIENAAYALDYMVDVEGCTNFYYKGWLYSAPYRFDHMQWSCTTAGKTLATALAARIDSFTLSTYLVSNGTISNGSANITGISDTSTLTIGQRIVGTGLPDDGIHNVCVASIVSGTEITMTSLGTAGTAGTKSLTFEYFLDSGNFNRRYFFSGMPIIVYDRDDVRNYMLARLTNYGETTGLVTLHVLNVFGDTAKSITNWSVMVVSAGNIRIGGTSRMCQLDYTGGYPSGVSSADYPPMNTMVQCDGIDGLDARIRINEGQMLLPKNSWQAQISTSSVTVGTGAKTFTIASGLHATMFAAGNPVYISGNTIATAQNWMAGTVTSYSGSTLVVNVTSISGSGTLANWAIAYDKQSNYLQTGTNANLVLREINATYAVPAASKAAEIRPLTNAVNGFTLQQYAVEFALTSGTSVAWNLDISQAASLLMLGSGTLANPTNMRAGATYTLRVVQGGAGSYTLAYGANYIWVGGAPVLSTAVGAKDLITFYCDGTYMWGSIMKGFA